MSVFTGESKLIQGQAPATPNSVLIADDDPISCHILQSCLQRWNYGVIAVDNGLDAWNALQLPGAPNMVILDWMMPTMDGPEVCRKIRGLKQGPYRYLLLLTSKDDKHDVVEGLEAGADDYLTKPFDVDELRARVRAGKRILELQQALLNARDALQFEAAHDSLTNLWNRRAIMDFLQQEVQRRGRERDSLGVMMADVDHFKSINDTHGHLVGDTVLQEVARRLTAGVRSYDWVGRYGGEEFLIVLPGCDVSDLAKRAECLRSSIAEHIFDSTGGPLRVTLSIGLASVEANSPDTPDREAFLRASDTALYTAKARGRNQVAAAPMPVTVDRLRV